MTRRTVYELIWIWIASVAANELKILMQIQYIFTSLFNSLYRLALSHPRSVAVMLWAAERQFRKRVSEKCLFDISVLAKIGRLGYWNNNFAIKFEISISVITSGAVVISGKETWFCGAYLDDVGWWFLWAFMEFILGQFLISLLRRGNTEIAFNMFSIQITLLIAKRFVLN